MTSLLSQVARRTIQRNIFRPTTTSLVRTAHRKNEPRFLSAIPQQDESLSPRRRSTRNLNPIVVTESAANRIKELLNSENGKGALGIRLGVKRRT
jgi:hypothetical protein